MSQPQVEFVLRQKKSADVQLHGEVDYQPLKARGFAPGEKGFFSNVYWGKRDQLGPFNLAFYWRRQDRGKGGTDPWLIMTSLPTLELARSLYACRWGIEMMFKDCKSGGYNLEQTKVNDVRFLTLGLVMTMADCLATVAGYGLKKLKLNHYVARMNEHCRQRPRHSDFGTALYGH